MGKGKPRKVIPHDLKTKQYREIVITALEELIKDIRGGEIEHMIVSLLDFNGELQTIVHNDKPLVNPLLLIGLLETSKQEFIDRI